MIRSISSVVKDATTLSLSLMILILSYPFCLLSYITRRVFFICRCFSDAHPSLHFVKSHVSLIGKDGKKIGRKTSIYGEFKGSVPPYGYRIQQSKLILADDDTPNVVKRIYRMYLEGKGFDSIARTLTREGLPTPAKVIGKKNAGLYWQGSSVKKILSNPHYVGNLEQGRQTTTSVICKERSELPKEQRIVVENAHPAIISKEDFEAVQRYMEGRKRQQAKPKAKKHLYTNHLYCADCGKSLWYVQYRKGYVCGNYYKHGKTACSQHSVKEKELTGVILDDLRRLVATLNEKEFMGQLEFKVKQAAKQAERQVQSLWRQIERLKEEKKNFIKLLASGTIMEVDYKNGSMESVLRLKTN
ncbi:hypothetical protein PAECIP111893_03627 [Paenibacillus plantiphilus]|uniref:Recombinase domain-containing protein n=1 Tax=Paenibacillus plantiphilus TaxID=2905650 RepID=A0ABN8GVD5_9BACL|nr:hypothetical protein PAECIP111893_03627 [Paenibacillus plantiphilus]